MISYDGRRFRSVAHGAVTTYRQDGDVVWAELSGSGVRRGALTGLCAPDGTLEMAYTMVRDDGRVISGRCRSTPSVMDDGRIRLAETWERFPPHADAGHSELEELP